MCTMARDNCKICLYHSCLGCNKGFSKYSKDCMFEGEYSEDQWGTFDEEEFYYKEQGVDKVEDDDVENDDDGLNEIQKRLRNEY